MEVKHSFSDVNDLNRAIVDQVKADHPGWNVSVDKTTGVITMRSPEPTAEQLRAHGRGERENIVPETERLVAKVAPGIGARANFATQAGIDSFPRAAVNLKLAASA